MHNVFAFKVTFLYKDFLARESPRTYLCRSIIMSYGAAVTAAIVSKKVKIGKPMCYEAPKVSVFNIVSEGSFCSSSLSVGSPSYTEDPEDFEYGGML